MPTPKSFDPEWEAELLAWENSKANNPYEPFQGVTALVNGGLRKTDPDYAPRRHWEVLSKFKIIHCPVDEIIAESFNLEPGSTL